MPRFRNGDVVIRISHDYGNVMVGGKYVVRAVDGPNSLSLCGFNDTYEAKNFKLWEEEKVVKPPWFVDIPPTPPSKMIKRGKIWSGGKGLPELSVSTDWPSDRASLSLTINGQSGLYNQEGLRKFAKEFNLLADAMDEIQKE